MQGGVARLGYTRFKPEPEGRVRARSDGPAGPHLVCWHAPPGCLEGGCRPERPGSQPVRGRMTRHASRNRRKPWYERRRGHDRVTMTRCVPLWPAGVRLEVASGCWSRPRPRRRPVARLSAIATTQAQGRPPARPGRPARQVVVANGGKIAWGAIMGSGPCRRTEPDQLIGPGDRASRFRRAGLAAQQGFLQ